MFKAGGKAYLVQGRDRRDPTASEDPNIQCDLSVTNALKPSDLASPNLTAYFVRRRKTLNVEVLNFNVN